MFKSIFSKYFVAISVIILCSALAMGGLQMLMTSRYWNTEKQQILEDSADDISNMAGQYAIEVPPGSRHFNLSPAMLEPLLNARAVASSSTVLIADANGAILLVANGQTTNGQTVAVDSTKTVPSSLLQNRGMYLRGDMVGGVFAVRQCVAVAPIRIQNETIGYILVTVSASGVNTALLDTVQAFLLSAIFALTLTFMVLYILTYRLVRPLRQMAKATQQFAAGDFSVRVKVDGQDEVAQLGHALNQMAATLSSSEEMRRSFIANVSHELKTPMTTIGGFVDGILDGTIP
ncbi:MAG: HAMP domain-containing protein, partial [Oscillospiraceae bacterium]|nr:HAMP domain-containing protein [Oscillospiraceae bacterium]